MKVSASEVISKPDVRQNAAETLFAGEKVRILASHREIEFGTHASRSPDFARDIAAGLAAGRTQQHVPVVLFGAGGAAAGGAIGVAVSQFVHPASAILLEAAFAVVAGLATAAVAEGVNSGYLTGITVKPGLTTPDGNEYFVELGATFGTPAS